MSTWARRTHFEYFRTYDNPMFSIAFPVNVGGLWRYAKEKKVSFFALCQYVMLKATNAVPQLRQRIDDGEVWEYESIGALAPVLAADGEFTQVLIPYRAGLREFLEAAIPIIEAAKSAPANANPAYGKDFAVFSCLPWIPFTQVASANSSFHGQDYPLIHWGKVEQREDGKLSMPVSIQANHMLVDGVHVGRFYQILQGLCDEFNGAGNLKRAETD